MQKLNFLKSILLFLFILFSAATNIFADNITSNGSGGGDWNNVATWSGGVVPVVGDNVTIVAGDNVNLVAPITINNLIIETGATFAASNFTHIITGNWTQNGTGQMTGDGTIQMTASLIQSITSNATFYNLTFNSGEIGVIAGNITVTNNFLVTNNTKVTTSQTQYFKQNFTVDDGSTYEATANISTFDGTTAQTITIGTTDGEPNVNFYYAYFDNGGAINPKTIDGNMIANSTTYIYNDAEINDTGNDKIHELRNFRIDGTCNFSGTIKAMGGTFYDDGGDSDFTVGTANIIVFQSLYVGSNDIMRVNGNLTVGDDSETYGSHLVVNNGSQLVGIAGKTLLVKDNKSMYIRDENNFPTGFGTITLEELSYARFDQNIANQNIPNTVTYGRLYLNQGTDKTALGNLDIESHLYLYNSTIFQMGNYDHTIAGHIYNSDDVWGNGNLISTGSVTMDAPNAHQYIYNAGTGTYVFEDLIYTQTAPTSAHLKRIYNDITVNGNFTATNTGGDDVKRLYIDIYENTITGTGSTFSLGANVCLRADGTNNFTTIINNFSTISLDVESTIRFNRNVANSAQEIPDGFTYGNIEIYGQYRKTPTANLDVNGNFSSVGGSPILFDNSNQINVAGDWNMHQNYTDLTGSNHIVFDGTAQEISNSNFSYVTFHNSGTKTLRGTLDILNNLYISPTVTVDANNQSIYIEGNWQENGTGTFQQTGGRVTFDGTSDNQTITTNTNSYFYSFTIDKTGVNKTVTANSDLDINGTFDFAEDNANFNLNGNILHVERDFYFRENCTFTHGGGKVYFDGISNAQLIRNYDITTIIFDDVEFVGTAVKRLYNNSFRFEGDVFINNSTLEGQSWDHYVEGDWINTGVYRHDRTLHFDGLTQNISQSNFHSVKFGGGANTKTLGGDIFLTGHLYIDDATLDVTAANHNITLDDYFYNDSTGSFICHQGTVTVTGEYNRIFTGETNTLYGTGQVVTQGGTKTFYNLEINASEANYWMFIHGDLTVLNDFTIIKGRFYQSYDPDNYGINDIYVGGSFINNGTIYNNNYGEFITLNPTSGSHIFDPGSSNIYSTINFNGAAGTDYTFLSNLATYSNRVITINNGTLNLNTYDITTSNSGGDINLNNGTLNANQGSIISMGSGATLTNAGGTFKLIGIDGNPASLIAATGNFNYLQTSGTSHFKYYRVENSNGNGIELSGGSLDATNSFQYGSFSEGTGTSYITVSGIDIGGDRTIENVIFNSGPTYNVQRTSGNGVLTFENASGTLAGEDYDNDDANPGTKILWDYPGAARWTGAAGTSDWHTANNWMPVAVPTSTSIVILDHSTVVGAYSVNISNSDADAKSVSINSGASGITLTLNTKELTIAENITVGSNSILTQTNATDTLKIGGSWSNEGTFNENTSVVVFNPTSGTHTINTQGAGDSFYDFIIKGTAGTNVISSTLDINGDVKIQSGTVNAGSQQITVAKNWSRTGGAIFDAGTSTVTFDGTNQTINGGEFYNFITAGTGTKTLSANIDINNDITINAGTILAGGTNIIYIGDDWLNLVGNAGFTQSGMGTVIFDGTTNGQDIGQGASNPTTFNNVTICGTQTKYTRTNITINGNLVISSAGLYIVDGTTIDGAGGSNMLNMNNGIMYVNGANNFPQNFETINLTGGYVDYYANHDQNIYPTTYFYLRLRRVTAGVHTTKTMTADITVNGNLYVYDVETLLDVNDFTINLQGNLDFIKDGRPIDWGAAVNPVGTVNHFGGSWYIDPDIASLNNVIKKNTGYLWLRYRSLNITGDVSILEDAILRMDSTIMKSTAANKSFTMSASARAYIYTPVGSSNDTIAFPINFTTYNLDVNSTVYLRGSGNQIIHTIPIYGNLYLYTQAEINQTLNGNLDVNGDFRMYYDDPTFVDNGNNINIAGDYIDIRTYAPTPGTTITFDGADQRILDASHGTSVFDMANVIFAGSGQKSLHYNGDDWYKITGNLTINSGVTVYIPRKLEFSGSTWTNNGIFNHTSYIVYFNRSGAQTIDPGAENDFYAVKFSGGNTKTFINNGIDANNGIFEIDGGTTVNMGTLTHNLATERVTKNGTWTTTNCNLIFDRNGTQYIIALTAKDLIMRKYDQWTRYRYLEGNINIDDLTIEEGTQLRCSQNGETTTATYNITMTGNFENNGYFYAYGNTVKFESDNTDPKTIKQGSGNFDNVTFNQDMLTQNTRTYTLLETTNFYEDLTIGLNATLDLNGQILRLGNNDPNDPATPNEEEHEIETGGTLIVDEGSSLQFSGYDTGNPILNVAGTLKVVGVSGNNANIKMREFYNNNSHRIDINITTGTIHAQYYLIQHLISEGIDVQATATIDNTNNFSNGTWSDLYTGGGTYLTCNADVTTIGTVDNVTFNYSGTPTAGTHFNVNRDAASTGILTFGGSATGLLSGTTYEADPIGENNTGTSKIEWPIPTEVYWTGNIDNDWFTSGNWSPTNVPTILTNAIIPLRPNNPIITAQNAVCKTLQITDGFLTLQAGWDLSVAEDVYVGIGTDVGILAIDDPACLITVSGNWTRGQNAIFAPGSGTVTFNAAGGSVSIDPRTSPFYNIIFNGGAEFMFTRNETFVDGDFTITSGTVSPTIENYNLYIKGNYNNAGGVFNTSTQGKVNFDASANQTITNGTFWHVTIDGSGTKSTVNYCVIDGNLIVKNGTLLGGDVIDMNNYVTIEATGTFNDGGFTHTFSGYRWTGTGGYAGTGTIEFVRDNHQYIEASKFNNLLFKNNGLVQLNGNVDVTGDVAIIAPNMYLNVQTYQLDNTSGTGIFSMTDNRRIYVRGANNFPSNFSTYTLHENSYSMYDGDLDQTIAPVPVVYGRIYLNHNTKTLGGHIDVNGILYMYEDVTLDVTTNNYRINLEGDWYNNYGATFIPHEGEVIFDGNNPYTYLRVYPVSKNSNPFYDLSVNKNAGELRSYWTDITVQNDLRVLNGVMYQNQTMYVGGDMSALSGTFAATGTYYLNKASGTSNMQFNGSTLNNLTINAGATYTLQDDLLMNGNFNLIAGTFEGNGNLVQMGNYGEVQEISGIYKIGEGGVLELPNYGTLKVNSGGEIYVVGTPDNIATVTNFNGRYYFNIENGGTIYARNYMFEYMAENGIYVKDGGIINENYNFSFGTFTNPANGGTCLRIENNQDLTEVDGFQIEEVTFPINPNGGGRNVTKSIASTGTIDFKNYYGEFAGEDYDNDPSDIINWISPPYIMWTGNIDNDWFKIGNWEVNSGLDRIPLFTDNVIITQRTNQPIIDQDGALAKSIDLQANAILTLSSVAATDTTLEVAQDVVFDGTLIMTTGNDTLTLGGNWTNTGLFMPGEGTVILNSQLGIKTIDNYNDFFYNLYINSKSTVQISRNTIVNNVFKNIKGIFDVTASNRQLTVNGNFYNYDNFVSQNGKVVLSGTNANIVFNPGTSVFNKIDINADASTSYNLTDNDLFTKNHFNIISGTFNLNSKIFNFGDAIGTDVITVFASGVLYVNANSYLKFANNSSLEVNRSGTVKILGSDLDNPAYVRSQSGTYAFNVNSFATIHAQYYEFQNMNADGIYLHPGALIDGTNNFSNGTFRNGTTPGQYLWLQNNFADFTVTDVYFHPGASINVKRVPAFGASGVVTFEDALGVLAGHEFEDDDNSATTGQVLWSNTHTVCTWIGSVSSDWNNDANWNIGAPHIKPTNLDIALIPDINEATHWNPILNSGADGVCYDLIIEDGGFLTIGGNKNLDMDNSLSVASNGIFTVSNGSVSNINVADIFMISGTFNHGGASTVIFDATAGKVLTITATSSFYNLTINSPGIAEYSSGSSFDVDGTFSILSGIYTISNPLDTIYIGKNWINIGVFNHGDGIVIFDGTSQSITNTGAGNFYDITLDGTDTKTLISDVIVENDIKIETNVIFNGASYSFSLLGDWTNRGIFTPATGTVLLTGTNSQLINNYSEENFYNFTLNNTATTFPQIILYGNLRLLSGSSWIMNDGIFETTQTEMLYVEDNVMLTGGDTENSFVSGPITKIGNDNFIFPLGDGIKFARLGMANILGNGTFVAQYIEEPYTNLNVDASIDHVSGYEHWLLNRTAGTQTPILTFYWEDGAESGIDKLPTLTTAQFVGTEWEDRGKASTTGSIAQGTITSNTAFTTFGACGFASYDVDNPLHCYNRWTGELSIVWNNPDNWTLGVPTSSMNTLIPAGTPFEPTINVNAETSQLILEEGVNLTVNPLKSLTTNRKFYIRGNFILKSDNTGNACFINNHTIAYGANCNVQTELYISGWQYHYVSSPTTNTHSDIFKETYGGLPNPNFYGYDELNLHPIWTDGWYEFTGVMPIMQGFAAYYDSQPTIIFDRNTSGDFNTGNKSMPVTYTEASAAPDIHKGWNFVGNPYPANLDWDHPDWTKTNVDNAIYFWNGINYSYYVGTGGTANDDGDGVNDATNIIPPMQGYFVKSTDEGTLGTPITARTTETHAFWKGNEPKNNDEDIIRLTVNNDDYSDETAIRFIEEATPSFDSNYDAYKLFTSFQGVPQIYSVLSSETISAINTLPDFYDELIIPIGFKATTAGNYTINVNDFILDRYTEIYFEDTYENQLIDLQDLTYNFYSETGEFNDRFRILFSVETSIKEEEEPQAEKEAPSVQIYSYGDVIYLASQTPDAIIGEIKIMNIAGQTIEIINNSVASKTQIVLNTEGIFIVQLISKYGIYNEKVIIVK